MGALLAVCVGTSWSFADNECIDGSFRVPRPPLREQPLVRTAVGIVSATFGTLPSFLQAGVGGGGYDAGLATAIDLLDVVQVTLPIGTGFFRTEIVAHEFQCHHKMLFFCGLGCSLDNMSGGITRLQYWVCEMIANRLL